MFGLVLVLLGMFVVCCFFVGVFVLILVWLCGVGFYFVVVDFDEIGMVIFVVLECGEVKVWFVFFEGGVLVFLGNFGGMFV